MFENWSLVLALIPRSPSLVAPRKARHSPNHPRPIRSQRNALPSPDPAQSPPPRRTPPLGFEGSVLRRLLSEHAVGGLHRRWFATVEERPFKGRVRSARRLPGFSPSGVFRRFWPQSGVLHPFALFAKGGTMPVRGQPSLDPARVIQDHPMPHPILLYDGVCGLCNRLVQFILRRDRTAIFRFASLQSSAGSTHSDPPRREPHRP